MSEPIHVLQIEDSPLVVELTARMLTEAKKGEFALESVGTLADGIARLARGGIDVVLLDLTLPDSQGLATFERLRAAAKIPVVIYTSLDDEELSLQALRRGAADYLVKREVNAKWLARSLTFVLHRDHYLTANGKSARAEPETTPDRAIDIEKSTAASDSMWVRVNDKRMVNVVTMEAIKSRLLKLVQRSDCNEIRVDFSKVEYVANAAISMLLAVNKQAKSAGKELVFCQVSPQVYEQFSSRRFDRVFRIEPADAKS